MKILSVVWLFCLAITCSTAQDKNNKQIAPELVGTWCYSNLSSGAGATLSGTCITLNDDGTYEFFLDGSGMAKAGSLFPGIALQERDFGSWSSQASTIYYNSSSRGEGSFQFQKINHPQNASTPMIVVNGQSFVSTTPHDPW